MSVIRSLSSFPGSPFASRITPARVSSALASAAAFPPLSMSRMISPSLRLCLRSCSGSSRSARAMPSSISPRRLVQPRQLLRLPAGPFVDGLLLRPCRYFPAKFPTLFRPVIFPPVLLHLTHGNAPFFSDFRIGQIAAHIISFDFFPVSRHFLSPFASPPTPLFSHASPREKTPPFSHQKSACP